MRSYKTALKISRESTENSRQYFQTKFFIKKLDTLYFNMNLVDLGSPQKRKNTNDTTNDGTFCVNVKL